MTTNLYALVEARPGHPNFGRPFYVGIGTDKRPYRHMREARSRKGHRNWRLQEVLASHQALRIAPGVEIFGVFETKDAAGEAEKEAIARYGRIGIEDGGILCNLAVGGQGPDAALMQMPEIRKRNSEAQKRRSPESRAPSIAALAASRDDPEVEARRRANSREPQRLSWADPDIRARRTDAMIGKEKTMTPEAIAARQANAALAQAPEAKASHAQGMLGVWQNPEHRTKQSASKAAAWQDPEKRANMLAGRGEGIAKSWQDPEVRARRIAGIKAAAGAPAEPKPTADPTVTAASRSAAMTAMNAAKTTEERSAAQARTWDDPTVRERRAAGIKAAAQDPALKAARLAAMLAGKRRKAAERAAAAGERV
jgi:hypothetical protein